MRLSDTASSILRTKGNQVWSISPEQSVFEAIEKMAEKEVGALAVIAEERLVGIISERDYARKVILCGKSSRETQVSEIMTASVITVGPDHTIDDCMSLMAGNRIRHLPVLDADCLLGMISIGDLVKWIISGQEHAIEQLEHYIAGRYPA